MMLQQRRGIPSSPNSCSVAAGNVENVDRPSDHIKQELVIRFLTFSNSIPLHSRKKLVYAAVLLRLVSGILCDIVHLNKYGEW